MLCKYFNIYLCSSRQLQLPLWRILVFRGFRLHGDYLAYSTDTAATDHTTGVIEYPTLLYATLHKNYTALHYTGL